MQSHRVLAGLLPASLGTGTHAAPGPRLGERRADPNAGCDLGPKPTPGRGRGLGGGWSSLWLGQGVWAGAGVGRAWQELPARPGDGRCRLLAGSAEGSACPRACQPLRHRCPGWERLEVPGCARGLRATAPSCQPCGKGTVLGGGPVGGWHWGGLGSLLHPSEPETPHRRMQPAFAALLMLPGHISLKI